MLTQRAQWPHTIADIVRSLDGVWGVVGATGESGNLYRLERSLKEPTVYTFTEYEGADESKILKQKSYEQDGRDEAVADFARAIGFQV